MFNRLRASLFGAAVLAASVFSAALASQSSVVMPITGPMSMGTFTNTYLNPGLRSLLNCSSGATAPTNGTSGAAEAFQCWGDTSTTPYVLRIYDGSQWPAVGSLNASAHTFSIAVTRTPSTNSGASYSYVDGDRGTYYSFTNSAAAITLPTPAPTALGAGWWATTKNGGTGTVTLTPTGATIDGAASLVLTPGQSIDLFSDGTNYVTARGRGTPTTTGLGAVFSSAAVSNQFLTGIGTDGNVTRAQPSASNLSNGVTGSGAVVLANTPTLITPVLGVATATSINGVQINASNGILNLGTGTQLQMTGAFTLNLTVGANSTPTFFSGADTVLGRATTDTVTNKSISGSTNTLSNIGNASLTNSSITIAGHAVSLGGTQTLAASDLTNGTSGSGAVVLVTGATLVTPTLGAASATSINKVAITAPATSATLTIADGKTLTVSNSLTFTGTDGNSFAFPSGSDTVVTLGASQTLTSKTLTSPTINGGTHTAITSLGIRSTGAAFDLTLASTEVFTAGRTLTIKLNDAARTVDIAGNLTLAAAFTTSGANALTLTTSGATNVTLPTTGTLVNSAVTTLSSLTSIGTIGTGVWQGTAVGLAYGGSGQATALAARGSSGFNIDEATSTGDANYTVLSTDRMVYHTALSAARTDTLPAANSVNAGQIFVINDFRGVATASNTVTLQRAGSDTINGVTSVVAINAAYGAGIFWSDGSSRWTYFPASAGGGGTVSQVTCGSGLSGGAITSTGTCALYFDPGSITNCTLVASVSSNALTVALKNQAGSDPSASSPCTVSFRSATAATGDYTAVNVTAATSFATGTSGSTFGSANSTPFRLWITAINNAGTVVLGVSMQSTATKVLPLNEGVVQTSVACNACTNAATAGTIYSTAAQTSKAIRILGYMDWGSGLSTAGTYASGPTQIQMMGPGVKRPGEILQMLVGTAGSSTTTSSSTYQSSSSTIDITPTSTPNLVLVSASGSLESSTNANGGLARVYRGSTAVGSVCESYSASGGEIIAPCQSQALDAPGTTSSTTYVLKCSSSNNTNNITCNFQGGNIIVQEIMGANDNIEGVPALPLAG